MIVFQIKSDIAFLTVNMGSQNVAVTRKVQRNSFIDKISMVGGNFGLFIGFSLQSLIEIFYWLFRITSELLKEQQSPMGKVTKA